MDGPASGFLKAVCNISPQTANAPPQSSAVSAWGKRDSQRMKLQLAFSPSPPSRIRKTSAGGIETDPTSRLPAKSNKITTPNPIPYFQPLLIVTLFSTQRHGGTEFSITFTKVPYLCVFITPSVCKNSANLPNLLFRDAESVLGRITNNRDGTESPRRKELSPYYNHRHSGS